MINDIVPRKLHFWSNHRQGPVYAVELAVFAE